MLGVRIGCSGFNYPHWKGIFYPQGLPQNKWFQYYCTVFSTVELNGKSICRGFCILYGLRQLVKLLLLLH
jgi:hypothetical protein